MALAPGRATELYTILSTSASGGGSGGYQHAFFGSSGANADAQATESERLEIAVRDFTGPITQLSVS